MSAVISQNIGCTRTGKPSTANRRSHRVGGGSCRNTATLVHHTVKIGKGRSAPQARGAAVSDPSKHSTLGNSSEPRPILRAQIHQPWEGASEADELAESARTALSKVTRPSYWRRRRLPQLAQVHSLLRSTACSGPQHDQFHSSISSAAQWAKATERCGAPPGHTSLRRATRTPPPRRTSWDTRANHCVPPARSARRTSASRRALRNQSTRD